MFFHEKAKPMAPRGPRPLLGPIRLRARVNHTSRFAWCAGQLLPACAPPRAMRPQTRNRKACPCDAEAILGPGRSIAGGPPKSRHQPAPEWTKEVGLFQALERVLKVPPTPCNRQNWLPVPTGLKPVWQLASWQQRQKRCNRCRRQCNRWRWNNSLLILNSDGTLWGIWATKPVGIAMQGWWWQ